MTKTKEVKEIKLGVGEIPLSKLIHWLNYRAFNKNMMVEYIKRIYDVDISNELDKLHKNNKILLDFKTNMYIKFNKNNPLKFHDDGSRYWFNTYGRKRYLKFMKECLLFSCDFNIQFDEILDIQPVKIVHHIYPMCYGGKNNLGNLISITDALHEILHSNPLEHIEKYCFQAVDYLRYLWKFKKKHIYDKYYLYNYDAEIGSKILKIAIQQEMQNFYDKLIKQHTNQEGDNFVQEI